MIPAGATVPAGAVAPAVGAAAQTVGAGPAAAGPAVAIALALVLDAALTEPPQRLHPVAWFGSLVAVFDREWSRPRAVGLAIAAALPLLAAAAIVLAVELTARVSPWLAVVAVGSVLFATTSLRMLVATAAEVVGATASDLPTARERLRWLVGRDATELSAGEVRSAAVESAAENLADGLVAPLLGFAVVAAVAPSPFAPISLAVGAGVAAWVKAVNTLDSMLGYPHKPHGTASARLDDAVMWVPARASAALLALSAVTLAALASGSLPSSSRVPGSLHPGSLHPGSLVPSSLASARKWADEPPSPNSGWPMATLAAVLDARLEKPGVYVLNPDAELPSLETSRRGIRIVGLAGILAYLVAGALASLAVALPTALGGVIAWS